jgi:hypothetical protein
MKKTLAILVAVLIIAVSAIPAFAVDIQSPKPTTANYQITIIPGGGGGTYDFTYKTPVDDDGKQTVHFVAKPDDGYKFTGWTFDGTYTPLGNLTDTEIDLVITGDIKATPNFEKISSGDGTDKGSSANAKETKIDNSTKSPKTGTNYVYVGIACVALIGLLFAAKKSIYKK